METRNLFSVFPCFSGKKIATETRNSTEFYSVSFRVSVAKSNATETRNSTEFYSVSFRASVAKMSVLVAREA